MGRRPIKPQFQGLRDTSMPQPHAPSQHHFLVIGRGLMGTSCACHLAQMGHRVTLIGPDEPQDRQAFQGPFASHHDAGRITRGLAENADWSKLALRSIERYGDFERSVGLSFYHQTGVMMCGPHTGPAASFSQSFLSVAERMQLDHDVLHGTEISQRFPWFEIPNDNVAAWEKLGGWINPRLLRRAMEQTAIQSGADIVPSWVARQTGTTVTLATGDVITGDHIVVATGGYCATADWCDIRPAMQVYARTVVLAQVSQAQAQSMAALPSAIILPTGAQLDQDVYILPPIQYPDGQYYIKIGGEESSPLLTNDTDMQHWFRSGGDPVAADMLEHQLRQLMPRVPFQSITRDACAVSFTQTGLPYIETVSDGLTLVTGGNGAAAKSCIEIGKLGAMTAAQQDIKSQGYDSDFHAVLA